MNLSKIIIYFNDGTLISLTSNTNAVTIINSNVVITLHTFDKEEKTIKYPINTIDTVQIDKLR